MHNLILGIREKINWADGLLVDADRAYASEKKAEVVGSLISASGLLQDICRAVNGLQHAVDLSMPDEEEDEEEQEAD